MRGSLPQLPRIRSLAPQLQNLRFHDGSRHGRNGSSRSPALMIACLASNRVGRVFTVLAACLVEAALLFAYAHHLFRLVSTNMSHHVPIPPSLPPSVLYTSCYCEENIWLLAQHFQTNPEVICAWDIYVVFVSNENKTVSRIHSCSVPTCNHSLGGDVETEGPTRRCRLGLSRPSAPQMEEFRQGNDPPFTLH